MQLLTAWHLDSVAFYVSTGSHQKQAYTSYHLPFLLPLFMTQTVTPSILNKQYHLKFDQYIGQLWQIIHLSQLIGGLTD